MSNRFRSKEAVFKDFQETSLNQYMYIDYNLIEDETLHTISMKFGISIADLKRINSLQNDRDIYALKTVKIPIKPNSYYSEKYADQIKVADFPITRLNSSSLLIANNNLESNSLESEDDKSSEDMNQANSPTQSEYVLEQNDLLNEAYESDSLPLLKETSEKASTKSKQSKEVKKFLKKLDNNLETLKNHSNELVTVVQNPHEPYENLVQVSSRSMELRTSKTTSKGLFNLNVRDILIIALVIVVLLPLSIFFYRFLYLKEHHVIP